MELCDIILKEYAPYSVTVRLNKPKAVADVIKENNIVVVLYGILQSLRAGQREINRHLGSVEEFFLYLKIHFVVVDDQDPGRRRQPE